MIEINLLPEELRKKESVRIALPDIPIKKTLILFTLGFVVLQLLLSLAALAVALRASGMTHEIEMLTQTLQETKKIKSQTIASLNRLKDIRNLTDKKFYWSSVLDALTDSVTKGIWLRSLTLEEGLAETPKKPAVSSGSSASGKKTEALSPKTQIMKLEGSVYAPSQETAFIGKFVKALKEHDYLKNLFSEIELSNINQRKISEYDVFDFVLLCKFKRDKI